MATLTPEQRELANSVFDMVLSDDPIELSEQLWDLVDRKALADYIQTEADSYQTEGGKDLVRRLRRVVKALRQPTYAPQALKEWKEEEEPRRQAIRRPTI